MVTRKQWIVIGVIAVLAIFAYDISTRKISGEDTGVSSGQAPLDKPFWKLYRQQNGRFEVLMPALPQHVSESHPNGQDLTKYDVYLAQDRQGDIFMISMTEYPSVFDPSKRDDILKAVLNGAMGSNSKNQLKSSERSTFLNLPALDFSIQGTDAAIRSKAILDDKILYVLTVMSRDSTHMEEDFKTFAESFTIKAPQKPTNDVPSAPKQ